MVTRARLSRRAIGITRAMSKWLGNTKMAIRSLGCTSITSRRPGTKTMMDKTASTIMVTSRPGMTTVKKTMMTRVMMDTTECEYVIGFLLIMYILLTTN